MGAGAAAILHGRLALDLMWMVPTIQHEWSQVGVQETAVRTSDHCVN
jgi:hypothetical protein